MYLLAMPYDRLAGFGGGDQRAAFRGRAAPNGPVDDELHQIVPADALRVAHIFDAPQRFGHDFPEQLRLFLFGSDHRQRFQPAAA